MTPDQPARTLADLLHNVRLRRLAGNRLAAAEGDLTWSCDCPLGVTGVLCKHAVAIGMTWLTAHETGPTVTPPTPPTPRRPQGTDRVTIDETTAWIRSLDAASLAQVLLDEAVHDDALRARLIARAALALADEGPVVALRHAFDQAARVPAYVPYRERGRFADGIGTSVDRFEAFLAPGTADAVIELVEHALREVESLLGVVDDSDGDLGAIRERLLDLHLTACRLAMPDPVVLARRLFAWEVGSEWGGFHRAAGTYADVLGPTGLAEYRRLAEPVWATFAPLQPGDRDRSWHDGDRHGCPSRFTITAIMLALAEVGGDVDEQIAVMARDRSSAHRYLEIATVCLEAGRLDQAIDWAEQGVRAFPVRTDGRLRRFLADRYQAMGRHGDAVALTWVDLMDRPDRERYRLLLADAEAAGARPVWRDRAMEHARSLLPPPDASGDQTIRPWDGAPWNDWRTGDDASVLVELLMADGLIDEAWQAAVEHGCRRTLWLELAAAREPAHPADAAIVYRREVEELIAHKQRNAYADAVSLVRRIARLLDVGGGRDEVPAYLAELRARHGRKRSFIELLDGARIGR